MTNPTTIERLRAALRPLAAIADAWEANELDDEARKSWGKPGDTICNTQPPDRIELYSGRGGRLLLTLADALTARGALATEPPDQGADFLRAVSLDAAAAIARDFAPPPEYDDPCNCQRSNSWHERGSYGCRNKPRSVEKVDAPLEVDDELALAVANDLPFIDHAFSSSLLIEAGRAAIKLVLSKLGRVDERQDRFVETMNKGLDDLSARAAKLEAVYAALRTWPIFADGKEITPELVSQEGLDKVVLEGKFDANVDRLKACEAIALGEEGWEGLANECPSTLAVANLRREVQQLDAHVHDLLGQVYALENNAENAATAPINFVDDEGTPGKLTWVDGEGTTSSGWSFDGAIVPGGLLDRIREAGKALLDDAKSAMHVMNDGWGVKVRWHYDDLSAAIASLDPRDERPIIANQTDAVTASLLGIGKAWSAFREGSVLGDSIGWGATREAAEADLRAKEELI